MADKQESVSDAAEQALEQGYIGEVPDEIENEAYTVSGQGPDTAKREREQRGKLRTDAIEASRDPDESSRSRSSSKSSSKSSGSSASSGSSSSGS